MFLIYVFWCLYADPNMLKDVIRYNRPELEVACEDFSNIIGSSSDSLVYKGNLKGGPEIAVISLCIKEEHWSGYLELYYQKEVPQISRFENLFRGGKVGVGTGRLVNTSIERFTNF